MDTTKPSCCSASRNAIFQKETSPESLINPVLVQAKPNQTTGMIYLPGETFLMGTDDKEGFPANGEGPVREITINPFYIWGLTPV